MHISLEDFWQSPEEFAGGNGKLCTLRSCTIKEIVQVGFDLSGEVFRQMRVAVGVDGRCHLIAEIHSRLPVVFASRLWEAEFLCSIGAQDFGVVHLSGEDGQGRFGLLNQSWYCRCKDRSAV